MRVSPFEKQLIDAALHQEGPGVAPGTALVLMPDLGEFLRVFQDAVSPALMDCGFRAGLSELTFDSRAWLSDAARWILQAEIIIADVTDLNADVMYTLGLCHGVGRCPLMISQDLERLPFNIGMLRCIRYSSQGAGIRQLRENLARAIRVFVTEADASRKPPE